MAREIPAPECLGEIADSYRDYCSATCPVTALCVLVAMGDYLWNKQKEPPPQAPAEKDNEPD